MIEAWAVRKPGFGIYVNTVSVTKSSAIDRFMLNQIGDNGRDQWHRLRDREHLVVVKIELQERQ